MPQIISMVPSWTEMLIAADVPLVGRTRFCIEPKNKVNSITAVGGTKDWDIDLIRSLNPNLLILDKDENPKMMSKSGYPFIATHVKDLRSCSEGILQIKNEIQKLGLLDSANKLEDIATRWQTQFQTSPSWQLNFDSWDQLPGLMEWVEKPKTLIEHIYYVIWKNPWMVATKETFIGHIADKVGLPLSQIVSPLTYPELDIEKMNPKNTLLLFSSEPFPFHKKIEDLRGLGFPSAIVDGQKFSWFGVGALKFLEDKK